MVYELYDIRLRNQRAINRLLQYIPRKKRAKIVEELILHTNLAKFIIEYTNHGGYVNCQGRCCTAKPKPKTMKLIRLFTHWKAEGVLERAKLKLRQPFRR